MYTLKEAWHLAYGNDPTDDWDGMFACVEMNAHKALLTNKTQGWWSCYTFNLITAGQMTMRYNDQDLTLRPGAFYTYTPGMPVTVLDASDDLRGYTMLAEESLTLETTIMRNIVRAAYLPIVQLNTPVITLADDDALHLQGLMRQIIDYFHSSHHYKNQSLILLYSLFLLDVLHAQEHVAALPKALSTRSSEIFLAFMRLLPRHFAGHHDIGFYASQLNITPTYLSRIVRQITSRTVIDYINQMLVMEASFLLRTSSLSISQIADKLHFSDAASFSKFFARHKGMPPRTYREG